MVGGEQAARTPKPGLRQNNNVMAETTKVFILLERVHALTGKMDVTTLFGRFNCSYLHSVMQLLRNNRLSVELDDVPRI